MWQRSASVLWTALALAASAVAVHAQQQCPAGQYGVSVLDDPQVHCVPSRPCSGVYGPDGLVTGVGSCPGGTGCALLPHNAQIMGCVAAGRADVSYVNPDGSLSRNGQVIAGPPTKSNENDNNNNVKTETPTSSTSPSSSTPGSVRPNGSGSDSKTSGSGKDESSLKPPSKSGSGSAGSAGSSNTTTSRPPTLSSSSGSSASPVPTLSKPASSPTPTVNQQNALDDINGDSAKVKRGVNDSSGMGLGSIIAIVIGCLAVVAIIAGVFVLRKKKEQALETPAGGLEDYNTGGMTPKENVLLL